MSCTIVMGAQWGDEGKGKLVDYLAGRMDFTVRYQGGANAGHTVVIDDRRFILHQLPSGVLSPACRNLIGNGCVVDPEQTLAEIKLLAELGIAISPETLMISSQAHILTPVHRHLDSRTGGRIGTTGRGIGPCYADKVRRTGIRAESLLDGTFSLRYADQIAAYRLLCERVHGELFEEQDAHLEQVVAAGEALRPFIGDTVRELSRAVEMDRSVLFEGAQGALLDLDHGTYPFVTSSSTTIGGAYTGGGVFVEFDRRLAVVKSYSTRVGNGPFPTEQDNELGLQLRARGHEYGATTGRPRRCGWLDLHLLRSPFIINGFNCIALTKLDVLSGQQMISAATGRDPSGNPEYRSLLGWQQELTGIREYHRLPEACRDYIAFIEDFLQVPVVIVSTGPARDQTIIRERLW